MKSPTKKELLFALASFIDDIESSGGVIATLSNLLHSPVASPGWTDLGESYLLACRTLGRLAKISTDDGTASHDHDCAVRVPFGECTCGKADREEAEGKREMEEDESEI